MKKKSLLSFLFFCFHIPFLISQSADWFETIMRTPNNLYEGYHQELKSIGSDEKHVYLLGYTFNKRIFFLSSKDTLKYSKDETRRQAFYLAQYTHSGKLIWAKDLNFDDYTYRTVMKVKNGFVYIAGIGVERKMIGNDTFRHTDKVFIRLLKLDSNGNIVWEKQSNRFFYTNNSDLRALEVDASDNIILGINAFGSEPIRFDNKSTEEWGLQYFFVFNQEGNALKAHTLYERSAISGGTFFEINALRSNAQGETLIFTSGAYMLENCFHTRISIFKIDKLYNIKHQLSVYHKGYMKIKGADIEPNGDFYLSGSYGGKFEWGEGDYDSKIDDCGKTQRAFVARLSADGQARWGRVGKTVLDGSGYDIIREPNGSLLWTQVHKYLSSSWDTSLAYPNRKRYFPVGDEQLILQRLSNSGVMLDSVHYHTELEDGDVKTSVHNGNIFLGGVYRCHFDSLSASICDPIIYDKIFLLKVGKTLMTKQQKSFLDNTNDLKIVAVPNPTEGGTYLHLNKPTESPVQMIVYDIMGRIVQRENFEAGADILPCNLSMQQAGTYFVLLDINNTPKTIKIIKN